MVKTCRASEVLFEGIARDFSINLCCGVEIEKVFGVGEADEFYVGDFVEGGGLVAEAVGGGLAGEIQNALGSVFVGEEGEEDGGVAEAGFPVDVDEVAGEGVFGVDGFAHGGVLDEGEVVAEAVVVPVAPELDAVFAAGAVFFLHAEGFEAVGGNFFGTVGK